MTDFTNNPENKDDDAFALPEGYFAAGAQRLSHRIACLEELRDYPVLASIDKQTGFSVPEAYFNQSALRLENIGYPVLGAIQKEAVFTTPENYFEKQQSAIQAALEEEDNDISESRLGALGVRRENVFAVPVNYFEKKKNNLEVTLKQREAKPAKVMQLYFMRAGMAAAAILLIALGINIFRTEDKKTIQEDDCGTLACIEKREILKSKQIENLDEEELLEIVNPKMLEQNLNEKGSKINTKGTNDSAKLDQTTEDLLDEI